LLRQPWNAKVIRPASQGQNKVIVRKVACIRHKAPLPQIEAGDEGLDESHTVTQQGIRLDLDPRLLKSASRYSWKFGDQLVIVVLIHQRHLDLAMFLQPASRALRGMKASVARP